MHARLPDVLNSPGLEAKRLATLRACAALAGFALEISDDDWGRPVFCIVAGALCERLASLDDVEQWLASVGAVETCP
jgi:hypothetical protein